MPKFVYVVLLLLIASGLVFAYVDQDPESAMLPVEQHSQHILSDVSMPAEPGTRAGFVSPDEIDDESALPDESSEVSSDDWFSGAEPFGDVPDTEDQSQDRYAGFENTQGTAAPKPAPEIERDRVVNVSISGSHVQVSSQGRLLWSREEQTSKVADNEAVTDDSGQSDNPYPDQPAQSQPSDQQANFQCPDSVYMGGNGYAVAMLKHAGCPKPDNYQGNW